MEMIDDKARVSQIKCLGCSRCEEVCPINPYSTIILVKRRKLEN